MKGSEEIEREAKNEREREAKRMNETERERESERILIAKNVAEMDAKFDPKF